ncbi:hypothetical protein [Nonomuraea guangzhouensis]|uniref:MFS transporter n=1 Tax=Nonomuraea guangzhouensis TaxID=1291555 RepID=A0ABW4GBX7_9ACTN|nr:hypothetical protein [Nonomuraea guangzhouensis]
MFTGRLGVGQASVTPEAIQALPEAARHATQVAFSGAVTGVFAWLVPILLLGAGLLVALKNVRLTQHSSQS